MWLMESVRGKVAIRIPWFDLIPLIVSALLRSCWRGPMLPLWRTYRRFVSRFATVEVFILITVGISWFRNGSPRQYRCRAVGRCHPPLWRDSGCAQNHITTRNWMRWRGRWKYEFSPEQYPTGSFTLGLLSLDAAVAATRDFSRWNSVGGGAREQGQQPCLGHPFGDGAAALKLGCAHSTCHQNGGGVLRDDRLPWYFEHLRTFRRWPVQGDSGAPACRAGSDLTSGCSIAALNFRIIRFGEHPFSTITERSSGGLKPRWPPRV